MIHRGRKQARTTAPRMSPQGNAALWIGVLTPIVLVFACTPAWAIDFVDLSHPAALDQPQINVVLRDSANNAVIQGSLPDELGGTPTINLQAYLDTGASGILLNNTVTIPTAQGGWGIQTETSGGQQVIYTDVGVVGSDNFAVSQAVNIGFAPFHPTVNAAVGPTNSASFYTQQINSNRTNWPNPQCS